MTNGTKYNNIHNNSDYSNHNYRRPTEVPIPIILHCSYRD